MSTISPQVFAQINKAVEQRKAQQKLRAVQGATPVPTPVTTTQSTEFSDQTDQTQQMVSPQADFSDTDRMSHSYLHNTLIFHQHVDGQYLLSVYPTRELGLIAAGVVGLGVAMLLLKRLLKMKVRPARKFKVKRIDL